MENDNIITVDYETLEEHLGNRLRSADNLDYSSEEFFPVSLIDMLFHFSEKLSVVENRREKGGFKNFHGHDFDRWIDNMIASTPVFIEDEEGDITKVTLVDIDSMVIDAVSGKVTITLPDETSYRAVIPVDSTHYEQMMLKTLDDLSVSLDLPAVERLFTPNEDNEIYEGFGQVAHIVRLIAEKSGIDINRVDRAVLSKKLFEVFKFELLPLIPSIWNDMEVIYDTVTPQLVTLGGEVIK